MPAPPLTGPQTRLLESLLENVRRWVDRTPLVTQVTTGTVVSVAAGGASDGNALVVVSWRGSNIAVPYLSGYTPTAGHVVAVARTGSQLLILGRVVGTP